MLTRKDVLDLGWKDDLSVSAESRGYVFKFDSLEEHVLVLYPEKDGIIMYRNYIEEDRVSYAKSYGGYCRSKTDLCELMRIMEIKEKLASIPSGS